MPRSLPPNRPPPPPLPQPLSQVLQEVVAQLLQPWLPQEKRLPWDEWPLPQVLHELVVVAQVSQLLRWNMPRKRLKNPPLSQQLSQPPPMAPPQPPLLQPWAVDTTAGGGGAAAGAGTCPANQADVTNKNAAFTRIPPFEVSLAQVGVHLAGYAPTSLMPDWPVPGSPSLEPASKW